MSDREFLWQMLGRLRSMRDRGGICTYDSLVHEIAGMAKECADQLNKTSKDRRG